MRTRELVSVSVSEEVLRGRLAEHGFLVPDVQRALAQAALSHSEQRRDNGGPYLDDHVYSVAADLLDYYDGGGAVGDPRETIITALLHDTVEDDPQFSLQKCKAEFGERIGEMVWRLSKIPNEEIAYEDKLGDVSAPHAVRLVKSADRLNNLRSSIDRLPEDAAKMQRYIGESKKIYIPLAEMLPDDVYAHRLRTTVKLARATLDLVA